jgi:hypothetical protein
MGSDSNADTRSEAIIWPGWLLAAAEEMPQHLQLIQSCHEKLRTEAQNDYTYEQVAQSQITSVADQLVTKGILDPETGERRKSFKVSKKAFAPMLYQNGSALRILNVTCAAKQMVLVHLLDSMISSLATGNLIVALICIRSLIEHVAHFDNLIAQLRPYTVLSGREEVNAALWDINDKLVKSAYATRVDWRGLAASASATKPLSKSIKYKPAQYRADVSADQILNAIDDLSKRVKNIRPVYEILCEFAHPNVGLLLGLTKTLEPVLDKEGVGWIRKKLSLEAPVGFVAEVAPPFCHIFAKVAECLVYFNELLLEADVERKKIMDITQLNLRYYFSKERDALSPYATCPCGSGAKVKFCCGSNKKHQSDSRTQWTS